MEERPKDEGKKEGSLGAWLKTRERFWALCEQYDRPRVQMLDYVVDAFDKLSAMHNHDLKLPVEFDDPDSKIFVLPRGVSVKNVRSTRQSRSSSAGAGKSR